MVEKPGFENMVHSFYTWQVGLVRWCSECYITDLKANIAKMMTQEAVIVQVTCCFYYKIWNKCKSQVFFRYNFKARDRKIDISIDSPQMDLVNPASVT